MKIVVFTSSPRVGGAGSLSIALANALAAEGREVYFAGVSGPFRGNIDRTYHATDNPNHRRCAPRSMY